MAEVRYSDCILVEHYVQRGTARLSFVGRKEGALASGHWEFEVDSIKSSSGLNGVQSDEIPRSLSIECKEGRVASTRLTSR